MGHALPHACAIGELAAPDRRDWRSLWQACGYGSAAGCWLPAPFATAASLTPVIDRTAGLRRNAILCVMVVRERGRPPAAFPAPSPRAGGRAFSGRRQCQHRWHRRGFCATSRMSRSGTPGPATRSRASGWTGLNWLLLRHGHGHWCLTLDADELLVYPHWETRPLPALTRWLESCGRDSFGALMLDMYPEGPLSPAQVAPGGRPAFGSAMVRRAATTAFRCSPACATCGSRAAPRARAFFADDPRRAPTLNKMPLVKWHWRYAYFNSTHAILPPA